MNDFIIGTAGHVDHGKTTLIKALTEIDTDRTPQEKKRGLSIELGFAYIDLASGKRVGIVDVPGHESFLKNMVSGAIGMDLVLLVVDVNEGIMPQTKEHLMILRLLGVQDIVVVMTKVRDVPVEKIVSCRIDIDYFLASFGFKNESRQIPIIPVDSLANIGIDDLKREIEKYAHGFTRNKTMTTLTRLNVDRSFSLKGVGTVVTGTLVAGTLAVNDGIWVYPLQKKVKIRQLQVHDQAATHVTSGQRVAIQLSGVKVNEIPKGSVLSCIENVQATYLINTQVTNSQYMEKLTHWQRVHLHIGTQTVQARLVPLTQEVIEPNQSDMVQLRLEQPIITFPGDRFILRSYSPVTTIAGGVVLNTTATKSRRNDEYILEELTYRVEADNENLLLFLLSEADGMVSFQSLRERSQIEESVLERVLDQLKKNGQVIIKSTAIITKERFTILKQELLDYLERLHEKSQVYRGVTLTDLFRSFAAIPPIWIETVLEDFVVNEVIVQHKDVYMLRYEKDPVEAEWLIELESFLNRQGLKATAWQELKKEFPDVTLLDGKEKQYYLYFVDRQHVIGAAYLNDQIEQVLDYLEKKQLISVAECRDLLGINRQQSIQLLEAMDKQGWTKRTDNQRLLIKKR